MVLLLLLGLLVLLQRLLRSMKRGRLPRPLLLALLFMVLIYPFLMKNVLVRLCRCFARTMKEAGSAMIPSEDALRFCWDILRNMPKRTDGDAAGYDDAAGFRVMVSHRTTLTEVFSVYNPVLVPDFVRCSLTELSEKDFTPEVVEYLGEYFEVELQKNVSAVREKYEKKRLKESAGGGAAAGAAASEKKKKRKLQFSPATDDMDVSPTGATAPLLLEGVVSPEAPRTDMELEILHQETVQKTAQIIDAIRSFDIYALSWVEHNLKECKKPFKKE
jgi:hypothetical protein